MTEINLAAYQKQQTEPVPLPPDVHRVLYPTTRRVIVGRQSLIYRLPNWRVARWAVAQANRYLFTSGSSWRLRIRYRDPRPGCRYGWGGSLKRREAYRFSVYIEQRHKWVSR